MNTEEPDTPKDLSSSESIKMAVLIVFGLQQISKWEDSSMRTTIQVGRDV